MKQKKVGIYNHCSLQFEVVLREGTGAACYYVPELGRIPRIKIGADYENWFQVVDCLIHEIMEFLMDRNQLRYEVSDKMDRSSDSCSFFMTHNQFQDICLKTTTFLTEIVPDLATAWKEWKKLSKK